VLPRCFAPALCISDVVLAACMNRSTVHSCGSKILYSGSSRGWCAALGGAYQYNINVVVPAAAHLLRPAPCSCECGAPRRRGCQQLLALPEAWQLCCAGSYRLCCAGCSMHPACVVEHDIGLRARVVVRSWRGAPWA
jgi:hypothetical protein